jgi:hypothetical protein
MMAAAPEHSEPPAPEPPPWKEEPAPQPVAPPPAPVEDLQAVDPLIQAALERFEGKVLAK